jgi:hypothetical protein
LVPTPEAKDSDSSQGRAIETPTPRSRVRREKLGEADVMRMGMFLWWSEVFDCRLSREAFGKMVAQVCGECRERSND